MKCFTNSPRKSISSDAGRVAPFSTWRQVDWQRGFGVATIDVRPPSDPRARDVADALLADPADPRTLQEWGHDVGASSRTLARAFVSDTGLSFGRWRTLVRLQASLPYLAERMPVSSVARRVGYCTTSAFVAAFRAHTGVTPGGYFEAATPTRG